MNKDKIYINFFGSIGVGKTTLGRKIEKLDENIQFIEEELDENPFINDFYNDMKKYGFRSSIAMVTLMLNYYKKVNTEKDIIIFDNGLEELIAYTNLEYDLEFLSHDEYQIYKKLYTNLLEFIPKTTLYVYFYCDPKISLSRIKQRNRDFESNIDLNFLNSLHEKYEEYVNSLPQDKLIRINANEFIDERKLHDLLKQRLYNML